MAQARSATPVSSLAGPLVGPAADLPVGRRLHVVLICLHDILICGGRQHIDWPLEADLHCAQRLSSNCLQQPMMTTAGNT
jgi:hypothetical protein